jgi:phage-related protein
MSGPTVTLTFAGDAAKLDKTFGDVEHGAKQVDTKVHEASKGLGDSFDKAGESIDPFEARFQGVADISGGLVQGFQGLTDSSMSLSDRLEALGGAGADLAGGFAQLVPFAGTLSTGFLSVGKSVLSFGSAMLASPITWIVLGIALIVAGIVLLIMHWGTVKRVAGEVISWLADKLHWVADIAVGAWHLLLAGGMAVFGWLKSNWPYLLGILAGPIGLAVAWIVKHWGTVKAAAAAVVGWVEGRFESLGHGVERVAGGIAGAFRGAFNFVASAWNHGPGAIHFSIPGWVPVVGGDSFSIPKIPLFDNGGRVGGPPGSHTLAMLQAGETVLATQGGGRRTTLIAQRSGSALDDLLVEFIRRYVRDEFGGDVQVAFGSG